MGRKKLDRTTVLARVDSGTSDKVKEIAAKLGYIYDGEGSISQVLDAIALGELILIQRAKNLTP
jgi:hypothetical protein